MGPKFLADVLDSLPQAEHPDLLVGFNQADDAGVYRINDSQALVQTVDFFPPIVDDPYAFGQIAAANALSDVYAMGGIPLTALNIVGFPVTTLPKEILTEILRGGNNKVEEAGATIVGGHSIKDKELKYGIAVTGIVHPSRIITNGGAKPGDRLFLTKPLGTGIITTAIKREAVTAKLEQMVIRQMATLNRSASEAMLLVDTHAATDITGFGLLGHAHEMAAASGVTIRIFAEAVPVLPEVLRLSAEGMNPGGANDNRDYLKDKVRLADGLPESLQQVLFDPQTSGGLLIAVDPKDTDKFQTALREADLSAGVIGEVLPRENFPLIVEPVAAADDIGSP